MHAHFTAMLFNPTVAVLPMVTHLRELLQALIEDARARGVEFSFGPMRARWAVIQTEWVTKYLFKSDFEVGYGGVIKQSCYEAYPGEFWWNDRRGIQATTFHSCLAGGNAEDERHGARQNWQDQWLWFAALES